MAVGIPVLFVLVFGLAVTGMVLLALKSAKQARLRRDALAAIASRLGFSFSTEKLDADPRMHGHFGAFSRGYARSGYNTLWGGLDLLDRPCPLVLGDYSYKTDSGTGKDRRTTIHRFSYLIAALPFAQTPTLSVRGENFFDKIAGVVGFEDINFESAEFSRRFHVSSSDKKFAVDLIDPRMMEFLMRPGTPVFQLAGGRILVGNAAATWRPEQFEGALAWLHEFVAHWPGHVVNRLGVTR